MKVQGPRSYRATGLSPSPSFIGTDRTSRLLTRPVRSATPSRLKVRP